MNTSLVSPVRRPSSLKYWLTVSGIVLLSLALVYLALVFGLRRGWWGGARTAVIFRVLPVPAATVDGKILWYAAYLDQRRAVGQYTAYLATSTQGVYPGPGTPETSLTTLSKMIRSAAAEDILRDFKIKVSSNDLQLALQTQLLQNGNPQQIADTIKQLYGWTIEQFMTAVIKPVVIREKIQEKLSFDATLSGTAQRQAENILSLVNGGKTSFQDLAKQYSEDVYGAQGGDLGFVTQGEQAKEIDDAAFSLEPNTVSGLIHTKYGFHIIQVLERKTVDGREQAHLLQITVLAPQVDAYITSTLQRQNVRIFLPHMRWDAQAAKLVTAP